MVDKQIDKKYEQDQQEEEEEMEIDMKKNPSSKVNTLVQSKFYDQEPRRGSENFSESVIFSSSQSSYT